MNRPKLYVDFNEMLESNLVLLSKDDSKLSKTGENIELFEGLEINIYMDDLDVNGKPDNLIASGVVEKNVSPGWSNQIKWCCRIDHYGIRHESDGFVSENQ